MGETQDAHFKSERYGDMIKKIEFSEESKELMEISHGGERWNTKENARVAAAEWIKRLKEAGLHGRVFIDRFATVLFYPDDLSMDTRRKAAECASEVELFKSGDSEWMVLPIFYVFYGFYYGHGKAWQDNIPFPTLSQAMEKAAEIATTEEGCRPVYDREALTIWAEGMEGRLSGYDLWRELRRAGYKINFDEK